MPGEAFQRAMRGVWPLLALVVVLGAVALAVCLCAAVAG
jgi:hypothetical protein